MSRQIMANNSTKNRNTSLTRRLFLLTSVFAIICVGLIALILDSVYRNNAELRFRELLKANLYNLLGSVESDDNGLVSGEPNLGDARFLNIGSGWYWSVRSTTDPGNKITSRSLAGGIIPEPENQQFDASFQRQHSYVEQGGAEIAALETQVYLGEGNNLFSFKVTGNRSELSTEISDFTGRLTLMLSLFAVGFVAASYGIVWFGLRPIGLATRRLTDIRDGKASRIEGSYPREIQPLIDETNALINSNQAIIERARTQVGNLAHAIKTPLAVLRNEAGSLDDNQKALVLEQASMMQSQVDNYLNRARIAARHAAVTSSTPIEPVISRLVRVIDKLNPGIDVKMDENSDWNRIFAGEEHDLEEILGNILENASRFAQTIVSINVSDAKLGDDSAIQLEIIDDGPGMNAEEANLALKRGMRLDETLPGSGLGLAIVRDYIQEYQGEIALDKTELGGLSVKIKLPSR
ncbi:MAG: ATP-binding protein [Rhizobiaceae bacterium]